MPQYQRNHIPRSERSGWGHSGRRSHQGWLALLGGVLVFGLVVSACSSDDGEPSADPGDAASATTMTVRDRPEGPSAEVTPITGDGPVFIGSPTPYVPDPGYVQEEFAAAGSATSYALVGEQTEDGQWTLEPDVEADYRTRIIVRRPEDPADFNGTVVVEWLNVSGGVDADAEWTSLHEEVVREGAAWVGVSAQLIGIEGGPVIVKVDVPGAEDAGKGLKTIDPERYGDLSHPGDAFANDIYTQVGRAIWAGDAMGDLQPERVIGAGESQSAFALVTYINGVHPLVGVYDGYFVHSRGPAGFPVISADQASADIAGSLGGKKTIFRTDLGVPVFDIQAENDVVGIFSSYTARQPDSDTFRLWEIAGSAHADRHLAGDITAESVDCGVPINDGPMYLVAAAAFHHLVEWIQTGTPPPSAEPLELTDADPASVVRDQDAIAQGGVRTPPVDVPVETLSGVAGPNPAAICILSGSTAPIPPERLADLYDSPEDYQAKYDAALDASIAAGFLLEADRVAAEGYADPSLVGG